MIAFGSGHFDGESAVPVGYTGTDKTGKVSYKSGLIPNPIIKALPTFEPSGI